MDIESLYLSFSYQSWRYNIVSCRFHMAYSGAWPHKFLRISLQLNVSEDLVHIFATKLCLVVLNMVIMYSLDSLCVFAVSFCGS